jgi:hypothetical protein
MRHVRASLEFQMEVVCKEFQDDQDLYTHLNAIHLSVRQMGGALRWEHEPERQYLGIQLNVIVDRFVVAAKLLDTSVVHRPLSPHSPVSEDYYRWPVVTLV